MNWSKGKSSQKRIQDQGSDSGEAEVTPLGLPQLQVSAAGAAVGLSENTIGHGLDNCRCGRAPACLFRRV